MVDNLEIKTPGPLPSGVRNIIPKPLNATDGFARKERIYDGVA